MAVSWSSTPASIRTAIICAALGFVITVQSTSSRTVNGRPVECSYVDFGALAFGAITIVAGIVGLASAWKATENRPLLLGVSGVAVAIGVLHILRGIGSVGGPCNL